MNRPTNLGLVRRYENRAMPRRRVTDRPREDLRGPRWAGVTLIALGMTAYLVLGFWLGWLP